MISFKNIYGVTGNPVLHSRSPYLFKHLHEEHGLFENYYIRIASDSPKEAIELMKTLGLKGLNVTSPFKESIIPYLDQIKLNAKELGAVNTIVNESNVLTGYNTDYSAVSEVVKKHYHSLKKKVLVIGAGGAAKSVVSTLENDGFQITVVNRTFKKLQDDPFFRFIVKKEWTELSNELKKHLLVINTTPFDFELYNNLFTREHVLINAVYSNRKYKTLKCLIVSGDEWLRQQAYHSFEIFNGIKHTKDIFYPYETEHFNHDHDNDYFRVKKDNISLIGFIGSGKTAVGKELAKKLNWNFIDTDDLIVEQENMTIQELFDKKGEDYFRQVEINILEKLSNVTRTVISTGGGIIFEYENRNILRAISNVYWMFSPLKKCIERIQERNRPPLDNKFNEKQFTEERADLLFNFRVPMYCEVAEVLFYNNSSIENIVNKVYEEDNKSFGNRR